jgi:HK97 family phage major capsid protein
METNEKFLTEIEDKFKNVVDAVMEEKLKSVVSPMVLDNVKSIVEKMRVDQALYGKDITGLSVEAKKNFVETAKALAFRTKANEALIEETDNRGGLLVAVEVADAILRIAASVGLVLSQAQKWPMGTDELDIPSYRGAFLTGEYLGVDSAGTPTALTFNSAKLVAKRWQLAFVVGNDLLADASANLADWLLALAGESLANMIDKQAFTGTGAPFVGLTQDTAVTVYNLGGSTTSGSTTFASFTLDDASDMIAQVEESMLDGAAFYFERTVWAKVRMKKDTAGNYVVSQASGSELVEIMSKNGGVKPAGMLLGYPVYTCRHLPANSATAVSTKFCVFGNLKAFAFGNRGDMKIAQYNSGSFGGKEIALADQTGLVYKQRHGLVNALPASFVVGRTSAS